MHKPIRAAARGTVILAAASLVLTACTASEAPSEEGAPTLTLGSSVAVQSWDPAFVGDANYVPYAQATYDSLIRRTVDDEYVPMLATEWEFSNDNKTITLKLRDDVTFSDGEAFNAEAVKANVEHFSTAAGPLGNQLVGLNNVEVLGEHEVALSFDAAIPDLLFNLSHSAGRMASPAAIGTEGLKTVPVGTGPYVMNVEETVQGSTYVLEAREDYWEPSLQKFDEVVFNIYADETGLLNALKSGQVQAGNLSSQDNIQNAKASGIEVLNPDVHISWAGLAIYDRAGAIVPALAHTEVRRAIAHAIDTEAILETAFVGEGQLNTQIFNESSSAYDDALNDAYAYDPELAKELLAEAGYADGFTLPLPAVSGFLLPSIQTALEQGLGEVGITIEWINTPVSTLYPDMAAGKFAASYVFFGSVPTEWSVVQTYLQPNAAWNPFKITDPELQALIDSIPAASEEERQEAYSAINAWEVENVWFDPWFWVEENYAVASDEITVELQPKNNVPFIYNYSPAS